MPRIRAFPAALLVLCGIVRAFSAGAGEKSGLVGTIVEHPAPAPDFTLTDQHGLPFHMAKARGKVVVMTFIYTHCDDLCPFVALKLRRAQALLGGDAEKVVFVAVTTDPLRDTREVAADYSRAAGLFDSWHFLTGPMEAVKDVWFDYGVGVQVLREEDREGMKAAGRDEEPTQGLGAEDIAVAGKIVQRFSGGYEVSHSTPYWLIDRSGRMRVSLDADVLPSDIAGDVRILSRSR